jgi:hypothetical protein
MLSSTVTLSHFGRPLARYATFLADSAGHKGNEVASFFLSKGHCGFLTKARAQWPFLFPY